MQKWMVIWVVKGEYKAEFYEHASLAWASYEDDRKTDRAIYRKHYISGRFARHEWRLVETPRSPADSQGASAA